VGKVGGKESFDVKIFTSSPEPENVMVRMDCGSWELGVNFGGMEEGTM